MRYSDFKLVEGLLGKPTDDKYLPAVNQLLKDPNHTFPVGKSGEKGSLMPLPGQQVSSRQDKIVGYMVQNVNQKVSDAYLQSLKKLDPEQVQAELKRQVPITLMQIADANIPNASQPAQQELKTRKISVLVSTLFKSDEIKLAAGKNVSDKEKYQIKPSQIFNDERFPASQVFNEVTQNKTLSQSDIGKYIIEMAKEIRSGKFPSLNNVPDEFQTAIRDYAGEYLGVLALIKGIANFPTRDQWFEHLGVNNLEGIYINFPQQSNFALGDSIGSFENASTGNMILISSKGGSKGAPPSLNNLKIPENLENSNEYRVEVDVIKTLQSSDALRQPFLGLNKIFEYNPDAIDPLFRQALPITTEDLALIKQFTNSRLYNKRDVSELPDKFRKIVGQSNFERIKLEATPGGIIHYLFTKAIIEAVNKNNALPNFEPMAREILQKNFIQIFARPKNGELTFDVLWPNKEMATGKIELYSKASSTDPGKAKLSFSVT
jgi:hypothetical protein